MLEVTVTVRRGAVLFAGETFRCLVTFTNTASAESGTFEEIAWGTAQLHCRCTANRNRVRLPAAGTSGGGRGGANNSFAFSPSKGEKGRNVYQSSPTILFCDLTLAPGEICSYEYESIVPATVPPSYRGESISYTHKVVVGTQRVSGEVKIVRLPFRVLPITDKMEQVRRHGSVGRYSETGLLRDMAHAHVETGSAGGEVTPGRKPHADDGEAAVFERPGDGDAVSQGTLSGGESGTTTATENSLAGSAAASVDGDGRSVVGRAGCITERPCTMNDSPFVARSKTRSLEWERSRTLYSLGSLTRRGQPQNYVVSSPSGQHVVKFSLTKSCVRLGEDLVGWFDFSRAQCTCLQILIRLETMEAIKPEYSIMEKPSPSLVVVGQSHSSCQHTVVTSFMLAVPLTSTPGFASDFVSVSWRLVFDFVLLAKGASASSDAISATGADWTVRDAPATLPVETMQWELPITVMPTNPANVPAHPTSQQLVF